MDDSFQQIERNNRERDSRVAKSMEILRAPKISPSGPFTNFPIANPSTADDAVLDVNDVTSSEPRLL